MQVEKLSDKFGQLFFYAARQGRIMNPSAFGTSPYPLR